MPHSRDTSHFHRLEVSLGLGLLFGCLYTAIDVYLDHTIGAVLRPSLSPFEIFHAVIDLVLPVVAGASLGVVIYFTRVRARMAAFEKGRADELEGHIHKIERDQAVWVISASLLHDLKTPLHALGLLLDEVAELPDEATTERRELVMRARAQGERLEAKLLALRSLENTHPLELPEIELSDSIQGLVERMTRLTEKQGIKLTLNGGPTFAYAHPGYLSIILENLIENAVDALHSCKDGRISLQLSRDDEWVQVVVSDNGPGLNEVAAQRLFDPLFSQKTAGLGLGLSIARGLSRSMGGELSNLSASKGATFELRLKGKQE